MNYYLNLIFYNKTKENDIREEKIDEMKEFNNILKSICATHSAHLLWACDAK